MDKLWFIDYRTGKTAMSDEDFPPFIPGEVDRLRQVKMHPTYFASRKGEVFSEHRDHLIKLLPDITTGYARLRLDGERIYVHQIIASLYCPKKIQGADEVFHIDRNNLNNNANNLCWVTHSEVHRMSNWTPQYCMSVLPTRLDYLRAHDFVD